MGVAATVTIDEERGEAIVVDPRSGRELWRYVYGDRRRPHIHPLATPAGHVLTRNAPPDHPWHHGLWFAIKYVNGENFWEEHGPYGVQRHLAAPKVSHDGGRPSVFGDLVWIRPDRETVIIREHRSLTHVPLDDDAYAIDFATTLVPEADVVLDRTPFTTWGGYGGLAFRGRGDLEDTELALADGRAVDRVLGEPGEWLDLTGTVDGATAGVTIVAAQPSARHPVPWYASTRADTYGDEGWSNFVNAAFLWDGPLSVAQGEPLRFAYRIIVHDGAGDVPSRTGDRLWTAT